MPPLPKDPSLRQRVNKSTTRKVLPSDGRVANPPKLPTGAGRRWHKMTRDWWRDLWASPMAPEYLETDVHGLFMLAVVYDDFWLCDDPKVRVLLIDQVRKQQVNYGLTPIDRRRLEWIVERAEAKPTKAAPSPRAEVEDPRAMLRVIG